MAASPIPLFSQISLNDKGVFRDGDFAFHVDYSCGFSAYWKGERIIGVSGLYFDLPEWTPYHTLEDIDRNVYRNEKRVIVTANIPKNAGAVQQEFSSDGKSIVIEIQLTELNWSVIEGADLDMPMQATIFKSLRFQSNKGYGTFPKTVKSSQLASNCSWIKIAPDIPELDFMISDPDSTLQLMDNRYWHNDLFSVSKWIAQGETSFTITLKITPPQRDSAPIDPIVHVSQMGYRPANEKWCVVELPIGEAPQKTNLMKKNGKSWSKIAELKPSKPWTRWSKDFVQFDFSTVADAGKYMITYGANSSVEFEIADDIYRDLAKNTLSYFMPFQMCHVRVDRGGLAKHKLCHMDDGQRVIPGKPTFDFFRDYEDTETLTPPGGHISADIGGWHDAGDNDINTAVTSYCTMLMSWAVEDFGSDQDVYAIDFDKRVVRNKKNGIPDLIEQIAWGAEWLLRMQRTHDGGVFAGIIASSPDRYYQIKPVNETTDGIVGNEDDRDIYTHTTTQHQLKFIAGMSAAHRALREDFPELSAKCLSAAKSAWDYFTSHERRWLHGPYDFAGKENEQLMLCAAAEMYKTTGEKKYLTFCKKNIGLALKVKSYREAFSDPWGSWFALPFLARIADADKQLARKTKKGVKKWLKLFGKEENQSPFGTYFSYIWHGWGSNTNLAGTYVCYSIFERAFPDIVPKDRKLRYLRWIVGLHPGPDFSFISGAGVKWPQNFYSSHVLGSIGYRSGTIPGALHPGPGYVDEIDVIRFIDSRSDYYSMESGIADGVRVIYMGLDLQKE